jgi:hypothetical protein
MSQPTVKPWRNTRSVRTSVRAVSGHDSMSNASAAKKATLNDVSGVVRDRISAIHP